MSGRGPSGVGRYTVRRRESDEPGIWAYVPVTVIGVVALGGLFTLGGVRPVLLAGHPFATVWNAFVAHGVSVFMHRDLWHFLTNAFMLVLFGGALTVLASNRHVLAVMLAAHVGGSVMHSATGGSPVIGSSLALAGVIAATVFRAAAVAAGLGQRGRVERLLGGWFAGVVIVAFAVLSVTGVYVLRIGDHHFGGWACGAVAELAWLAWLVVRD